MIVRGARRLLLILSVLSLAALCACGVDGYGQEVGESTQLPYAEGSLEGRAVLAVANDESLGVHELSEREHVGLDVRAATNIVARRSERLFESLADLWSVSYCKRVCFDKLLDYAKRTGVYGVGVSVVFSPQAPANSHLAEVAARIDAAEHSIDIAMYSYAHQDPVRGALTRARERGVVIRFLAETNLANAASRMAPLEEMGIDVRRVTRIMHHKFAIIDGPRSAEHLDRAAGATVASGSANWSGSAASIYDENTVFFSGYPELVLRMQRDFDTLWAGSRDVVYNAELTWDQTSANITDDDIAAHEDDDTHIWFTSANFAPSNNQGWSSLGTTVVTDALVEAILRAEQSLEIASGHFVSIPIAEAVLTAIETTPALDVNIVLDCQEVSKGGAIRTIKQSIEQRGGRITYKCNTYRWHYSLAAQMHHKYMVIDGTDLYTGSLNFSDNAEINTFENMMMFRGPRHRELVQAYRDNFQVVATYGHEGDRLAVLEDLWQEIEEGSTVPLAWNTPVTLDQAAFDALRDGIRSACPAAQPWADSPASRTYARHFNGAPRWFGACHKEGYPWPLVPEHSREN